MSKGNTYTDEFKDEATQLAFSLGSTSQAAKNLNIPKATLHTWVKETKSRGSSSTSRTPQIDVSMNRNLLKHHLKAISEIDFDIDLAEDGIQAVKAFKETVAQSSFNSSAITSAHSDSDHKPYDLIFMDIMMPNLNGDLATKQIRLLEQEYCLIRIPIIAVTGNATDEHRAEYLGAGMDAIISKPYIPGEVAQVVEQLISQFDPQSVSDKNNVSGESLQNAPSDGSIDNSGPPAPIAINTDDGALVLSSASISATAPTMLSSSSSQRAGGDREVELSTETNDGEPRRKRPKHASGCE